MRVLKAVLLLAVLAFAQGKATQKTPGVFDAAITMVPSKTNTNTAASAPQEAVIHWVKSLGQKPTTTSTSANLVEKAKQHVLATSAPATTVPASSDGSYTQEETVHVCWSDTDSASAATVFDPNVCSCHRGLLKEATVKIKTIPCKSCCGHCNPNPCVNGGVCVNDHEGDRAVCVCPAGFTGDNCEHNIDDCALSQCLHGGTCVDGVDSFVCNCAEGFTGAICEHAPEPKPEEPVTPPTTPEEPKPEEPKPQEPETPTTPPHVPETPTIPPHTPETPSTPPSVPETPSTPPHVPETPSTPPSVPETPHTPETPSTPPTTPPPVETPPSGETPRRPPPPPVETPSAPSPVERPPASTPSVPPTPTTPSTPVETPTTTSSADEPPEMHASSSPVETATGTPSP